MTNATITVTGNLGQDAELKFTSQGRPVLSFSLAHTPRRKNPSTGEWEDAGDTQWYRGTLWGREAEVYADILVKGQVGPVTITGDLKPSIFESKSGPRISLDVTVHAIGVREARNSSSSNGYRNTGGNQHGHTNGGQAGDPWATGGSDRNFTDEPPF